jgi:hypothetical protein
LLPSIFKGRGGQAAEIGDAALFRPEERGQRPLFPLSSAAHSGCFHSPDISRQNPQTISPTLSPFSDKSSICRLGFVGKRCCAKGILFMQGSDINSLEIWYYWRFLPLKRNIWLKSIIGS